MLAFIEGAAECAVDGTAEGLYAGLSVVDDKLGDTMGDLDVDVSMAPWKDIPNAQYRDCWRVCMLGYLS